MMISCIFTLGVLIAQISSIHLKWNGGFAGKILMRAYNDPELQQAVKTTNTNGDQEQLRRIIANKIANLIKNDSNTIDRLANASFPSGRIGRVQLTQEQKGKLLNITINNLQVLKKGNKDEFISLVQKDDTLKNVYNELVERRNAFKQVRDKLFSKVKADPIITNLTDKGTDKQHSEYRQTFRKVAAKYIKQDPELQKIVAKARFGFDALFSKLTEEERVKLLNILINNDTTAVLRVKSPQYLKAVSTALLNEPTLKYFYDQNQNQIQGKIKQIEQRKVKSLPKKNGNPSHLLSFEDILETALSHFRQKTLPASEIILQRLKQHPRTRFLFVNQGYHVPNQGEIIRNTTIQIIKSDYQLQRQFANDLFSRGAIGKFMNEKERVALLNIALQNPTFFEPHTNQGALKRQMIQYMKQDPILYRFYYANQKKILANVI